MVLTVQDNSGSYRKASSIARRLLLLSRSTPMVTIEACLKEPLVPGTACPWDPASSNALVIMRVRRKGTFSGR
jgi:hypothetical protein